jgi:nicotinamide-nucleotide amidase
LHLRIGFPQGSSGRNDESGVAFARLERTGQESCYRGGVIGPSMNALASLVHPPASPADPSSKSAEHTQIAAICNECRENFTADFALFVGQFPKYDREDTTKSAPVSHAALVGKDVSRVVDYTFLGDMTLDKSRAAKIALNLLRLHLLRGSEPDEARP